MMNNTNSWNYTGNWFFFSLYTASINRYIFFNCGKSIYNLNSIQKSDFWHTNWSQLAGRLFHSMLIVIIIIVLPRPLLSLIRFVVIVIPYIHVYAYIYIAVGRRELCRDCKQCRRFLFVIEYGEGSRQVVSPSPWNLTEETGVGKTLHGKSQSLRQSEAETTHLQCQQCMAPGAAVMCCLARSSPAREGAASQGDETQQGAHMTAAPGAALF